MNRCDHCGQIIPDTDISQWPHGETREFRRPYTTRSGKSGVAKIRVRLNHPEFEGDRYFSVLAEIDDVIVSAGKEDPESVEEILSAWDAELSKSML